MECSHAGPSCSLGWEMPWALACGLLDLFMYLVHIWARHSYGGGAMSLFVSAPPVCQRTHIFLVVNEWTVSHVGPCLTARGPAVSMRCGFLCVFHGLPSEGPGSYKLSAYPRVGQGLVFVQSQICHISAMCSCHLLFNLFTLSMFLDKVLQSLCCGCHFILESGKPSSKSKIVDGFLWFLASV